MSNHPMCKECVAVSVCGVKYGQPSCVKVHGLVMSFGKTVANSGISEAEKSASDNTESDAIALWKSLIEWINADKRPESWLLLNSNNVFAVIAQRAHIS